MHRRHSHLFAAGVFALFIQGYPMRLEAASSILDGMIRGHLGGSYSVTTVSTPMPGMALNPSTRLTSGGGQQGAAAQRLTIVTTSLADGQVHRPYAVTLQAEGGSPPYVWKLDEAFVRSYMGPLRVEVPPGLAVHSQGSIEGVPTQASLFLLPLKVTDREGRSVRKVFRIRIKHS